MLTVCTHCKTRFKVTTKQLKAAAGQVRCGKCDQVFDAYAALDDTVRGRKRAPKADETAEDISVRIEPETQVPEIDTPLAADATPPDDVPPIQDLFAGLPDEPDEKPLPPPLMPDSPPLPMAAQPTEAPPQMFFVPAEDLPAPPLPKPRRPALAVAWWSGIVLLALVLAAQLVNADREALGQNLVIGSSLQAFYAALGDPLPPAQAVGAWDVSGVNVTTDPDTPGALSITGSLANQASFVQPWPDLRVVLTDRYGDVLRARDFKPGEYLPGNQANVRLASGLASRFRLDIVDPGADAVGFTLTPCLDGPGGRICSVSERD